MQRICIFVFDVSFRKFVDVDEDRAQPNLVLMDKSTAYSFEVREKMRDLGLRTLVDEEDWYNLKII